MEKYTREYRKRMALLIFIKWSWKSRNPGRSFDEEYGWKIGIELEPDYESGCPWCSMFTRYNCGRCPILHETGSDCMTQDSLYRRATSSLSSDKDKKVAAGEIANIAWKEYKRLGG